MSMATLERAILAEARRALENPRLKNNDILEWSTGEVKAEEGEVVFYLPDLGVHVAVKKEHDRREAKG